METIQQGIKLSVETPKAVGGGLAELIQQLERVDRYIARINAELNGMSAAGPARTKKELESVIKGLQAKGTGLGVKELAKGLGHDVDTVERYLARMGKAVKGYQSTMQTFRTAPTAAEAFAKFEAQQQRLVRKVSLGTMLTPTASTVAAAGPVTVAGGTVAASVQGQIPLLIPAAQVQASVVGTVTVPVAGGGGGGGGGKGSTKGSTKGATKGATKNTAAGSLIPVARQAGEFERVRTETEDALQEVIHQATATGEMVASTYDSVEGWLKTVRKTKTGRQPLDLFRERRKLEQASFAAGKAGLKDGDYFGLARLQEKQAAQLRAMVDPTLAGALGPERAAEVKRLLHAQADVLETQAKQSQARGRARLQAQVDKNFAQRKKDQSAELGLQRELEGKRVVRESRLLQARHGATDVYRSGYGPYYSEMAAVEQRRIDALESALRSNPLASRRQRLKTEAAIEDARSKMQEYGAKAPGLPPVIGPDGRALIPAKPGAAPPVMKPDPSPKPTGEWARLWSGLRSGFSPVGFAANLVKVTGWAAAVTALYKSFEVASYSAHRFLEVGLEQAKLTQVFKGVGGSVQQLTDDILQLASANGRNTDEAMGSAREWARLGLSRTKVGEAVGVSLAAANVAPGLTVEESTKHLSSLMHIYGLEVRDLNGVLGMLVGTSQRYNVTVEDLFQGLDRSAGVARQAGMSLAELQGILGATVGKTGQTGVVVGNTIKSVLVQFNNPEIQRFLRGYGVSTLTKEGAQKNASQVMREVFVRYQSLSDSQRQHLTMRVAGRMQAARFVGMMDSYVESQRLAIESQLRLNSAQEANAKILGTVKMQLTGVRAEWDRLIISQMNKKGPSLSSWGSGMSPGQSLEQAARLTKNVLRLSQRDDTTLGWTMKWGTALARSNLSGMGLLAAILNNAAETPLERSRGAFGNKVQEHAAAQSAYEMRAQLFETIGAALPGANRPEARQAMVDAAADEMGEKGERFKRAVAAGDQKEGRLLLHSAATEARGMAGKEMQAQVQALADRIVETQAVRDQLQGEVEQLKAAGGETDKLVAKRKELASVEKDLRDLQAGRNEGIAVLANQAGATDDQIERKAEYVALLKEEEQTLRTLEELSSQGGGDQMSVRIAAQATALETQLADLRRMEEQLRGRSSVDDQAAASQVQQQIVELEGQRSALTSPRSRALAEMYDARRIAQERAAVEGGSYGVGYTEGERLRAEEAGLQRELGGLRAKGPRLTENDAVRGKQMEIQLWRVQEQIQLRIVDLARQERQIRMDAQREFARGLMLAGPGEMLQRLHASELMRQRGGITPGQFFGLSPELRRQVYEGMGGEAGMMVRRERQQLGAGQTVEGQQAAGRAAAGRIREWGRTLEGFTASALDRAPAVALPLEVRARNAAEQIGAMATAAAEARQQLKGLGNDVKALRADLGRPGGVKRGSVMDMDTGGVGSSGW